MTWIVDTDENGNSIIKSDDDLRIENAIDRFKNIFEEEDDILIYEEE